MIGGALCHTVVVFSLHLISSFPKIGRRPLRARDVHGGRQQTHAEYRSRRKHPSRGAVAGRDGDGWGWSHAPGPASYGSSWFPNDGRGHAHGADGTDDARADG